MCLGESCEKKSKSKKKEERVKEEASSVFQRRRVDGLLDLLTRKFPLKIPQAPTAAAAITNNNAAGKNVILYFIYSTVQ